MTKILEQLKTVIKDLNELKTNWALVGALAASIYSEPRTTRDIDIAISLDLKEEQERLLQHLIARGYSQRQELMHFDPTWKLGVRLQIPCQDTQSVALDLLFSSTGIEAEIVENSILIEIFPQIFIPTASLPHILAMKILSQNDGDRIRDRTDIQMLLKNATINDIEEAKKALTLIHQRAFDRGKNLNAEFLEALKKYAPHFLI